MSDNYQPDYNNAGGDIPPRQPLSRGQKLAAGALAIFAVLVIVMWAAQFKRSIMAPLNGGADTQNIASEQNENSDLALKTKDTDGDGLSDYDELNIYKTSPYLDDSDSDGVKDKEEIDNGKDPNCPEGTDCYGQNADIGGATSTIPQNNQDNSSLNSLLQLGNGSAGGQGTAPAPSGTGNIDIETFLGKELDAPTLRQMLLQAGMKQDVLDKISDEDLMKSYQEVSQKK
jgi:hypothetical protein